MEKKIQKLNAQSGAVGCLPQTIHDDDDTKEIYRRYLLLLLLLLLIRIIIRV